MVHGKDELSLGERYLGTQDLLVAGAGEPVEAPEEGTTLLHAVALSCQQLLCLLLYVLEIGVCGKRTHENLPFHTRPGLLTRTERKSVPTA
jgi:hypothetical protein